MNHEQDGKKLTGEDDSQVEGVANLIAGRIGGQKGPRGDCKASSGLKYCSSNNSTYQHYPWCPDLREDQQQPPFLNRDLHLPYPTRARSVHYGILSLREEVGQIERKTYGV